jgi:Mrp family chromosome partitioning ATPase
MIVRKQAVDQKLAQTTTSMESDTAVHLILQGKGGVGKSLVAAILAQYFGEHGREVHCVDTDPVNHTFSQYSGLNVARLDLMAEGTIDPRVFDSLMEQLLTGSGVLPGESRDVPLTESTRRAPTRASSRC